VLVFDNTKRLSNGKNGLSNGFSINKFYGHYLDSLNIIITGAPKGITKAIAAIFSANGIRYFVNSWGEV
jgi:hypothetical protein